MKEGEMSAEMNKSIKSAFFSVELPMIDRSSVNMGGVNTAIDAVKSAAKDGYTTATQAATKVRHNAGQTVTLVREAIGV